MQEGATRGKASDSNWQKEVQLANADSDLVDKGFLLFQIYSENID